MSVENYSKAKLLQLKNQGFNRMPLVREVLADLDTPLSTYLKLANAPYTYLFESVQGGEKWGRYSIIGLPCKKIIKVSGYEVSQYEDDVLIETQTVTDPLQWIDDYQSQFKVFDDNKLPRFTGGLVGYFGYETIGYIEKRLAKSDKPDPLQTPDILLMVSEEVVVFDNLSGKLFIIVQVDTGDENALKKGETRLQQIADGLDRAMPAKSDHVTQTVNEEDFVRVLPSRVIKMPSPKPNSTLSMATSCRWCCRSA